MRRLWPRSLWGQIWLSTILILALAQIVTMLLFGVLIVRPETERVANVMAQNVATTVDTLGRLSPVERTAEIEKLSQSDYLRVWSAVPPPDANGPPPRAIERIFMQALGKALGNRTDLYWRTDHARQLWVHVYVGGTPYWISIASPPILGPTGMFGIAVVVTLLLASAAAIGLGAHVLRPLNALRAATVDYKLSARPAPLPEGGPTEIAAVSKSFNRMTERLAQAEVERTLVLAGISHDVRTPLAKLKLAFEMMSHDDAELTASAQRQIDAIDRILSSFMTFARGFDSEPVSDVDLSDLADKVAADYVDHGVIRIAGNASPIRGRPEALRRALINLVENAIRYGAAPVEVIVSGRTVVVRDHGSGVADTKISTLIEPFVRGDPARQPKDEALPGSGTGLGLAIVEKVARVHDGTLVLCNIPHGFEARLHLRA